MSKRKFLVGECAILLEPVTRLPAVSVVIVGYEASNDKQYRIEYKIQGSSTFYSEDVEEDRLTSQKNFGLNMDQISDQ